MHARGSIVRFVHTDEVDRRWPAVHAHKYPVPSLCTSAFYVRSRVTSAELYEREDKAGGELTQFELGPRLELRKRC